MELYSGYYYKIIKKARREGDLRSDIDICILSAKYGLIDANAEITEYDQKMNRVQALDLQEDVETTLIKKLKENNYKKVVINAGEDYRVALKRFIQNSDIEVEVLHGQLGERGSVLKKMIRESQNT